MLTLFVLAPWLAKMNMPSGPVPTIVPFGTPVRQWRSIGRAPVMNTTLLVAKVQGWTVQRKPSIPGIETRYSLGGRFASNEAIVFVVIDPQNYARIQFGQPPLIAYHSLGEISTDYPEPGSFYGLVRPSAPEPIGIPTSMTQLALRLLASAAQEYRPPAQVTFELWVDGQCLCTVAEAARYMAR
jgi:hypothetical protein